MGIGFSPKTSSLQELQTIVCFRSGLIPPVPTSLSAAQVQKELDEYGDIVFVKEKTNYKSILVKTYFVLEYAVLHYDVRYILKTDDDAYINVGALLHQLRLLCQTPDCRNERLYMGKMAKARMVLCVLTLWLTRGAAAAVRHWHTRGCEAITAFSGLKMSNYFQLCTQ